jgi:hypothetical protein
VQIGMRLAVVSVWPQIRQGAGKSTAATASTAFRIITEVLLTERVLGKVTSLEPASEGMKLRTQIYAMIYSLVLRDWADESDLQN